MLYEFKSKAAGTVVMTQPVAEKLLAIIGKPPGPAGVFEPAHLAAAIAALQSAVERDAAGASGEPGANSDEDDAPTDPFTRHVGLKQRAWPLIDLMKAALAADKRVTWGV